MGSIDKRLENLERRAVASVLRPARIKVVYEDAPEEVLYTITVAGSRISRTPEREDRWGA